MDVRVVERHPSSGNNMTEHLSTGLLLLIDEGGRILILFAYEGVAVEGHHNTRW